MRSWMRRYAIPLYLVGSAVILAIAVLAVALLATTLSTTRKAAAREAELIIQIGDLQVRDRRPD